MRWLVCLMLAGGVACQASEPATSESSAAPPAEAADGMESSVRQPLDLRLRDIREYITPEEFQALHESREIERNTVIVQADAPLLPVKSEEPIPAGMPLLPLWWAVTHPTQAWRIFMPDLNRAPSGPPDNKIPPREFRWGP